jgi:hypothetical protein
MSAADEALEAKLMSGLSEQGKAEFEKIKKKIGGMTDMDRAKLGAYTALIAMTNKTANIHKDTISDVVVHAQELIMNLARVELLEFLIEHFDDVSKESLSGILVDSAKKADQMRQFIKNIISDVALNHEQHKAAS